MGKAPKIEKGVYRHYKGGMYEVLDVACHTETLEWFVIYQSLERREQNLPSIWIRPYAMFTGMVEVNSSLQPRFKKLDS